MKISPSGIDWRISAIDWALAIRFGVITHSVLFPAHSFVKRSRGPPTEGNGAASVLERCAGAGAARAALMRARIFSRLGFSIVSKVASPDGPERFARYWRHSALFCPRPQGIEKSIF